VHSNKYTSSKRELDSLLCSCLGYICCRLRFLAVAKALAEQAACAIYCSKLTQWKTENFICEQYIPLTIEISVFTTFKPSEGYIAKPEAEQRNTYTASKKELNSLLCSCSGYICCWLRLRLRDILLEVVSMVYRKFHLRAVSLTRVRNTD